MDVKKIYETRFINIEERKLIWQVLVTDFFQQYINKNDIVLDAGCGYGEFINNIVCGKKLAIDLNPEAKKHLNTDVKFFLGSTTKMTSIKEKSIDKIFVSNFFEHLEREDIALTINECRRILKEGGQILILQPNIRFLVKDFWRFFDHITPIDDRAMEELFNSKGFFLKKIILKFLPFTTKNGLPKSLFLVRLYLKIPFLWNIFGKQSFLIFEKL